MSDSWSKLSFRAGRVFTPGAPISEPALFSGRIAQVGKIIDAISQPGHHAILYGERGVGKTSLSNVLSSFMQKVGKKFFLPKVNCDSRDTFTTLWTKLLHDVTLTETRQGAGFVSSRIETHKRIVDELPDSLTPDHIRRVLTKLSQGIILVPIFDEFDRIEDARTCLLMADAIKSLSDYSVDATILIIGVADSVDELIKGHQSIERALIQIPMPRMSNDEISEIIEKGLNELKMDIEDDEKLSIVNLSQGLPYVAHLLSLHSAQSAIRRKAKLILQDDLQNGISVALEDWQQSIKTAYYDSTKSQQPGNRYREVVLACALATTNEFGYFSAANVRDSLLAVMSDQSRGIPNPTRYLKQLSGPDRGELLHRIGRGIRLQYRFSSPLMRPYIVMRGIEDGAIARERVSVIMN